MVSGLIDTHRCVLFHPSNIQLLLCCGATEVELAADVKTLLEKWSLKAEVEMNCVKEVI